MEAPDLAEDPKKGLRIAAIAALVLAAVLLPLGVQNIFLLHILIMVFFYAYMASAWNLLAGFAGQLSFGHAAFAGIGAYISTLLFIAWGISPWIGMAVGGLAATVVSVLVGYPCFRLRGAYYSLVTIAFAEIIRLYVTSTQRVAGIELKGAAGLVLPLKGQAPWLFQFDSKVPYYYTILVMLLAVATVGTWVKHSKPGYYLAAIRDNQDAAEALGVKAARMKLYAAALSGFFTGMGGTFYAQYIMFIDPVSVLGIDLSVNLVVISVIGGIGTVTGPVLGSFFMTPLSEVTRLYLGSSYAGAHLVLYGLVLMLVVAFMPRGLWEALVTLEGPITRWWASARHRGMQVDSLKQAARNESRERQ
jgi:branched-chain amino acid transport system permease protein